MKRTIKLPAPQLSQLKEVNIDLCMTGRHFALLATCEGELPEDVALSILKDLMEEDASKLTLTELRYLFMLVKIHSLEGNYRVGAECTNYDDDGNYCGHNNVVNVTLADSDLNPTPPNYKVPEITWRTKDTEKTYKIMPPTMATESAIYDYFLTQKGANPEKIFNDKALRFEYGLIRAIVHLVDSDGNRLVKEDDSFEGLMEYLDYNDFIKVGKLQDAVTEVNKYGVQETWVECKCEKCGGKLLAHIPLLAGLAY